MSGKASKAMIAVMLGSLMLILGGWLSPVSPLAGASAVGPMEAFDAIDEDVELDEFQEEPAEVEEEVAEEEDEELLSLALDMKLAEKDLEALVHNESNRVRFFDPQVTKGLVDREMLANMMLMQKTLLDDFDESEAEALEEEDPEDLGAMNVEEPEAEDVENAEADAEVEEIDDAEEEEAEVEELDDEELLKVAMEMKIMEKGMEDFLDKADSDWTLLFNPDFNKGFIDRPLLEKLALLRENLLEAHDGETLE